MSELCGISNITLVSIGIPMDYVISVKPNEKKIVGLIGHCIDKMLGKMEDRKCNIISEEYFGVKLDNGTYTGALGLLQSGKGHLYLKGEPHFIDEDWLQKSLPLRTENIWAGQVIDDENKFDYFDLLENFKFGLEFYLSYFFAFLIFGLSCFYLIRSNLRENNNYSQKTSIFLWLTNQFITNSISANMIVVDTSELVKNQDDLMRSKLVCFFQDDTAYNLALNSPKNSLLFRLFNEKTKLKDDQNEKSISKTDHCFLQHSIEYLKSIRKNTIMIITQIEANVLLMILSTVNLVKKIFLLNKGIQEYNAVIYYVKYRSDLNINIQLKDYLRFTNKLSYAVNEYGTSIKLYDCMESNAQSVYSKNMKVYEEVYEYVEDNTGYFSNLDLNNFSSLFVIYFGFLTIIFIVFFIFHILPFYYFKLIDKYL